MAAVYVSPADMWNVWQCDNCDQISHTRLHAKFLANRRFRRQRTQQFPLALVDCFLADCWMFDFPLPQRDGRPFCA
jgi:hypothetical protein